MKTNTTSIIERNRAICQFLNFEQGNFTYSQDFYRVVINGEDLGWVHLHNMKFHTDWNWMMYVINKAFNILVQYEYDSKERTYLEEHVFPVDYMATYFLDADINTIFATLGEFIEWYDNHTLPLAPQRELFEEEV